MSGLKVLGGDIYLLAPECATDYSPDKFNVEVHEVPIAGQTVNFDQKND